MGDDAGRATRAIIMMIDGAIQELISQGYDRRKDRIQVDEEDPTRVTVGGRTVFMIDFVHRDGKLNLEGRWTGRPRLWTRIRKMFRRARAS